MRKIYYIFLLLFVVCSCEYPFDPKLGGMNSQYSVEGYLTTDSIKHSVRFYNTKSYQSTNTFVPISDAEVAIVELLNGSVTRTIKYSYIDSISRYMSDEVFKGLPGYVYRLQIKKGNDEIIAQDTMKNMLYMDSIRFKANMMYKTFPNGKFKQVILLDIVCFAQEPATTGDGYIWDTYLRDSLQRDSLLTDSLRWKVFQNDQMVNGNYISGSEVSSTYLFPVDSNFNTSIVPGTQYVVSISHISNNYFMYLVEVMMSTEWRMGPFSGPPANPVGNVFLNGKKSGVFGYFATESVTKLNIIYNPLTVIPPY